MGRKFNKIIISRTDSIGDVVLTLPLAGKIKEVYPNCKIVFLGKKYTRDIIQSCVHVDQFMAWDDFNSLDGRIRALSNINADAIIHAFPEKHVVRAAFQAKIPLRIATGRRLFTLRTCNRRIWFSRKKSNLHESQLNFKLLRPLRITEIPSEEEISKYYGLNKTVSLDKKFRDMMSSEKKNLIFHPKSKGSAVEWPLGSFNHLIDIVDSKKYHVFITGTEEEGQLIRDKINWKDHVTDLTGAMSLNQYIAFLQNCDLILAGSTGPLHIASASGTAALGLYSPAIPIHPGRWKPIGQNAHFLVNDDKILDGYLSISPQKVYDAINEILL